MNQPRKDEILKQFAKSPLGQTIVDFILDRYHLIDKSEPIPGAVSDRLVDLIGTFEGDKSGKARQGFIDGIDAKFDIYPKGTVARLTGEVEEFRKGVEYFSESRDELEDTTNKYFLENKKLQAEVDRLNGENETLTKAVKDSADSIRSVLGKKPEAVGCGRHAYPGTASTVRCGYITAVGTKILCPDCQAGANSQAILDSSKRVQLPEVPNAGHRGKEWGPMAEGFMQAVKAHLEGTN